MKFIYSSSPRLPGVDIHAYTTSTSRRPLRDLHSSTAVYSATRRRREYPHTRGNRSSLLGFTNTPTITWIRLVPFPVSQLTG